MRRWRAIYFLPLFVLLIVGAVIAGYKLMLAPQMENVEVKREEWETERATMEAELQKYPNHLKDQVMYSQMIISSYDAGFAKIQQGMPDIYNIPKRFTTDKERLEYLYDLMGSDKLLRELTKWARGFNLDNTPQFAFSGTLGFTDTISELDIISVDFDRQRFRAKNIHQLLASIQKSSGYGYYPLFIRPIAYNPTALGGSAAPTSTAPSTPASPFGATPARGGRSTPQTAPTEAQTFDTSPTMVEIIVKNEGEDQYDPYIEMDYNARGYFMVRDWDPMGNAAVSTRREAEGIVNNPPKGKPMRAKPPKPCPNVLWIFEPEIQDELRTPDPTLIPQSG